MARAIKREDDLTGHVCSLCLGLIYGPFQAVEQRGVTTYRHAEGCAPSSDRLSMREGTGPETRPRILPYRGMKTLAGA